MIGNINTLIIVINYILLGIYDMNIDNNQIIKLDVLDYNYYNYYCIFNSKNEFILLGNSKNHDKVIWTYSTQTKNNKWKCKRMYKIPLTLKLIGLSNYDKLYLYSDHSIYEWDLLTEKSIKIFGSKEIKYDNGIKYDYKDCFDKVINILELFFLFKSILSGFILIN
jgi:hypothetical protein